MKKEELRKINFHWNNVEFKEYLFHLFYTERDCLYVLVESPYGGKLISYAFSDIYNTYFTV